MESILQSFSKDRPDAQNQRDKGLVAWPGWSFLGYASVLSAANAVWFWVVYGGCEWLTAHRSLRVPIHLPLEVLIPFIPGTVVFYMSIYLLFLAGPFVTRERRAFAALNRALALTIFLGGIGFLLVPAQLAYREPGNLGIWAGLFHTADWLNLTYNLVPSLHVALSVCCVCAYAPRAAFAGRVCLWAWTAAIALSTLLTHQHHLVDVVTGWVLGVISHRVTMPGVEPGKLPKILEVS